MAKATTASASAKDRRLKPPGAWRALQEALEWIDAHKYEQGLPRADFEQGYNAGLSRAMVIIMDVQKGRRQPPPEVKP